MCWPLSGGGDGSPSRSGSVWTAPPRVGRASTSVTSAPPSTQSSAAASPASPPPTTTTLMRGTRRASRRLAQDPAANDAQLAERGEARPHREHVVAAPLDLLEDPGVDPCERAHAQGTARVEQG